MPPAPALPPARGLPADLGLRGPLSQPAAALCVCVCVSGKLLAVDCGVELWLERQGLGVELARHGQYLPQEVGRWRGRAVRAAGSRRPLGYSLDGTNSVSKNNPGLGATLQNFPSSFSLTKLISASSGLGGSEFHPCLTTGNIKFSSKLVKGPWLAGGGPQPEAPVSLAVGSARLPVDRLGDGAGETLALPSRRPACRAAGCLGEGLGRTQWRREALTGWGCWEGGALLGVGVLWSRAPRKEGRAEAERLGPGCGGRPNAGHL